MDLLINLVQENEIFYSPVYCKQFKPSHADIMRDEGWKYIAKQLGTTKYECKSFWWSLRNDLKTAIRNKSFIRKTDRLPYIISDFEEKYEKKMEFLLPYIETHTPGNRSKPPLIGNSCMQRKRMPKNNLVKIIDITDSQDESDPHSRRTDGEREDLDFLLENGPSTSSNTCKRRKLLSNNCVETIADERRLHENLDTECGELIIELDDEVISVPARLCDSDESDDDEESVSVKVRPSEDIVSHSSSEIPLVLEVESDGDEGIDIEIPMEDLTGDLEVEDEVDLVLNPEEHSNEEQLNLLVKEKLGKAENASTRSEDDADSELFYYSTLATAADQIDSYKARLQLRKEITRTVLATVEKYLKNKTEQ
ncbi:uncharacterized protein [Rhodnius prolixus]|uniref:MADF domain-containing protein n=2 Tax=Rhodnius prolixus TaxID=13249 RepID=T1IC67_RHOPR